MLVYKFELTKKGGIVEIEIDDKLPEFFEWMGEMVTKTPKLLVDGDPNYTVEGQSAWIFNTLMESLGTAYDGVDVKKVRLTRNSDAHGSGFLNDRGPYSININNKLLVIQGPKEGTGVYSLLKRIGDFQILDLEKKSLNHVGDDYRITGELAVRTD